MLVEVLNALIEAAESADNKLHSAVEYLKRLRDAVRDGLASPEDTDNDQLLAKLRAIDSANKEREAKYGEMKENEGVGAKAKTAKGHTHK